MLRTLTALIASLLLLTASTLRAAESPPIRTLAGEIEGARWTALVPDHWDGRLLLEAPDCLRAPEPLAATLDATGPATSELLATGWAIATTSYRRHGPLIADGISDIRALREHLAAELGPPKLTLVEGTGMGGLIATFIAERHADEFHGCLAHEPQLDLRDPRALRLRCDHQPRAPLLLLASTTAELVQGYIARARATANAESVVPVIWFAPVDPAPTEESTLRLAAIAAMEEWARTRKAPDERPVPPPPEPEPATVPTGSETPVSEPETETSPPIEAPAEPAAAATATAPESAP